MRKQAFTLLEMLISLAIVVVVLGASIAANRALLNGAQITSDQTHMSFLVDETAAELQLLQRQIHAVGGSLGDAAYFNLPDSSKDATSRVIPYADATAAYTSPVTIRWCNISNNTCTSTQSSIRTGSGSVTMSTLLTGANPGGELIAVRHTPAAGRQEVSMASRLSTDNGSFLNAGSTTDQADWDFYVRTINVTRLGRTGVTYYGQPVSGAQPDSDGRAKTYVITITVKNFLVTSTPALTRTVVLTDN